LMKKGINHMKRSLVFTSIVILLTAVGSIALAQGPGQGNGQGQGQDGGFGKGHRGGGLVHKLNRALEAAGAEELGPDQKDCIAGKMEAFRANMPEFERDGSALELHQAYAQAVLNGDPDEVIPGLAEEIALVMAAHTQQRLMLQAELQMQVQECLGDGQLDALRSLDPKQQAWLVGSGAGGFGFASGQRGERGRPGRN
jgi:hypothetical protein